MIKIIKSAKSIEEMREIIDDLNLYKSEKLRTIPKATYVEDYKNFSIYHNIEENIYFAISEKSSMKTIDSNKKKIIVSLSIVLCFLLFYLYNSTTIFWSQERKQEYKKAQILKAIQDKFPEYLKLSSNYYIKEIFINGKQIKWFEHLGESELIPIADLGISLEDSSVEISYVQYSVNGFGWHINETKKNDRITIHEKNINSHNLKEASDVQVYQIIP